MTIAIVDCGGANLRSVQVSFERKGYSAQITQNEEIILNSTHVVLPGVGEAGKVMKTLTSKNLINCIKSIKKPLLGVCVGMHVLYEYSDEKSTECLSMLKGSVKKFPLSKNIPLPQMGWNKIKTLLADIDILNNEYYFFANSYFAAVSNDTIAESVYSETFSAIVKKDNILGCQFHPEKSSVAGEKFIDYFLTMT